MDPDKRRRHRRVFLSQWRSGRPWLQTFVEDNRVVTMACSVCRQHPVKPPGPGKRSDSFVRGSCNFRLEAILRHEASATHRLAQRTHQQHTCPDQSDGEMSSDRDGTTDESVQNTQVTKLQLTPLVRNAHTIAVRGEPLSTYTWLCELDMAKGLEINPSFTNERNAKEFIHCIAQAEREKIQAAVQHCRFATVLVLANTSQAEGGNVQRGLEVGGRELLFLRCAAQGEVTTWFVHHMEPRCSSNKKELGLDKTVSIAMGILDVHFRRTDDNTDSLYHKLVALQDNFRNDVQTEITHKLRDALGSRAPWIRHITQDTPAENADSTNHQDINSYMEQAAVIADLTGWPRRLQKDPEFGNVCMMSLVKLFPACPALSRVRSAQVVEEWRAFKLHLRNSLDDQFNWSWQKIHATTGNQFPNVLCVLDLVLTLAPTRCPMTERGAALSSDMNCGRNCEQDASLRTAVLTIRLHSSSISQFNPDKALELWAQRQRRTTGGPQEQDNSVPTNKRSERKTMREKHETKAREETERGSRKTSTEKEGTFGDVARESQRRDVAESSSGKQEDSGKCTVTQNSEKVQIDQKRHQCPKCERCFVQKVQLKYHLMTHAQQFRFYCERCGRGFQVHCLLVRHALRVHSTHRPHACALCAKRFKTSRDLRVHNNNVHDPSSNVVCATCGRTFRSPMHLAGHVLRFHAPERLPLGCPQCERRFRHVTLLAAHLRTHTGETPFQCDTCGRMFKQKGHLTAHRRTHSGERPFRCERCGVRFTVSSSLQKHIRFIHEGQKCTKPVCTKSGPNNVAGVSDICDTVVQPAEEAPSVRK